ncbi:hypothetical protein GCM10010995_20760 [Cysteiniphilum litorale]|uniref:Uncharacterized protein n=1 Tax=Cysteiniphilum litorale TaxID=2056700 RepID=A0A8J3E9P5_9GAMM|nr:hypothetical protein GCM10010995_20760 [Cysteiniphilum litorale]
MPLSHPSGTGLGFGAVKFKAIVKTPFLRLSNEYNKKHSIHESAAAVITKSNFIKHYFARQRGGGG